MKMRKLLALVLCLCLILPLCSAAFATGNEGEQNTDPTATPVADAENPPVETPVPPAVDDPEPDACTCGAEEGAAHAADCPLYTAPGAASPAPAADPADPTPAADPAEPIPAAEIDTAAIVERLLAAATLEELAESVEALTDAEIAALSEEQIAAIEARFVALEPAPLPPVVIDETADAPVESEIFRPSRNYSNAAPFRDPVSGPAKMRLMAARAATAENSGMEIDKKAVTNTDGSYTITLEAYATGAKVITEVTEEIPTDIVLVLDQSGSMAETMYTYDFRKYTDRSNSYLYSRRHNNNGNNGNLYYPLEDGSFATVSVTRARSESTFTYTECPSDWQNNKSSSWNDWDPDDYWKYSNNLYVKIGEEYQKVALTRNWDYFWYTYTYTFPDNSTFVSEGDNTSPGNFGGKGPLYYRSENAGEYTYTYTYTDADGVTQTIGTSTGADTQPTEFALYERYQTGSKTRLEALKDAVTSFAKAVEEKAKGKDGNSGTEDDVNHRIAVVGFACSNTGDNDYYNNYQNTEVFIGSSQYKYGNAAQGQYGNALQSMNTPQGQDNVTKSIGALEADGATYVNHGIEMANGIFNANPVPAGEKRNRVVIVFTDGAPGYSGFESGVASSAITQANTARALGANVYAVGIFQGADATSAGDSTGDETQKANWFMQNLSDNKGTPQTPSYYLSAADAGTLKNIFQQISDQIETGGSSTTLSSETVIKDIIAPAFTLPEGASASNITLETYQCTGKNGDAYTWSKNADAMGATATVNGDTVSVTGFDFAENYVGTVTENGNVTYRGHKLVIKFTVTPKAGFLGGNGVYTNTSAGVYADDTATDPVLTFPQPQVNVPIDDVTVTAADKNVYLLGGLTAAQLKEGATVKVGSVELDLSSTATNYGLEAWQTEYVNITVEIKDANGNVITTDLTNLTDDTTYTISVTVTPKTDGKGADGTPATAKSGANNPAANIHVFKPELTFKDSEVYYGDTAPDYTGNLTDTKWKHGDTASTTVTMIGTAPTLSLTYTPEEDKIADGKINTKQDIAVDVTVKIDETDVTTHTTFQHTNCTGKNCTVPADKAFLLHVKTCSLTVTKAGSGSMTNGTETHIFTVEGPNGISLKVAVQGNGSRTITGLPVGYYTVTEDTDWSWRWRYADEDDKTRNATLEASENGAHNAVTITNNNPTTKWLSGDSVAINKFAAQPASSAPAQQADAPAALPEGPVELSIKE